MNTRQSFFGSLPPVTKNLLIINLIVWLADMVFAKSGIDLTNAFGLWYFAHPNFHLWQPITYMFMHAGFSHIFFNMFAVMMFGVALERHWGSKRYLIYYLATGIGAGLFQELVWTWMGIPNHVTIGASGAVYGILLAFAWLFPETRMFIFPFPMPIKARTLVIIYFAIELFSGFSSTDNVAHFAHLGGMLFGVLLILWWKKKGLDTGEGLWDADKMKAWWQKMTSPKRTSSKTTGTNYSQYHYQEPIKEEKEEKDTEKEAEINRILDKIKLSGYDSLTDEEKRKLFNR